MPHSPPTHELMPVSPRNRNQLIRLGRAFEPPAHCRPTKGRCLYVDTKRPDGTEVPTRFRFRGYDHYIRYVDGCFFPFIFADPKSGLRNVRALLGLTP